MAQIAFLPDESSPVLGWLPLILAAQRSLGSIVLLTVHMLGLVLLCSTVKGDLVQQGEIFSTVILM